MGLPSTDASRRGFPRSTRTCFRNIPAAAFGPPLHCRKLMREQQSEIPYEQRMPGYWIIAGSARPRTRTSVNQASTVSVRRRNLACRTRCLRPALIRCFRRPQQPAGGFICTTDGTAICIQLRADAVGYAVTNWFANANSRATIRTSFGSDFTRSFATSMPIMR